MTERGPIRRVLRIVRSAGDQEATAPIEDSIDPTRLDTRAQTKTLVFRVLDQIDREAAADGDYMRLVPKELQPSVDQLAVTHYPTYEDHFPTQEEFTQAMARNWLGKYRSFSSIALDRGYIPAEADATEEIFNNSVIACLTTSASYVFLGPQSLVKDGDGSMLSYTRIPLRQDPNVQDVIVQNGARIISPPAINVPLHFRYMKDGIHKGVDTSPLLAVYRNPDISDPLGSIRGFVDTVKFSSSVIDSTLRGSPSGFSVRHTPTDK